MIQYAKYNHKMKKMNANQQRIVGQKIYEEAYEKLKTSKGDALGACGVIFTCPYSGHVSYLIAKTFDERVLDKDDPTVFARVEHIEENRWLAFAIVTAKTEQDAVIASDACVMSAVMQPGTVPPSFSKYLRAVREVEAPGEKENEEEASNRIRAYQEIMEDVFAELNQQS